LRFVEVVLATEFEVTKSSTLERASRELWRNSWYESFLSSTREKSGAAAGSNLGFFVFMSILLRLLLFWFACCELYDEVTGECERGVKVK
jgi:hypothetical protein